MLHYIFEKHIDLCFIDDYNFLQTYLSRMSAVWCILKMMSFRRNCGPRARLLSTVLMIINDFILLYHCDHLAWRIKSWSVCFSCICMFIFSFSFSLPLGVGCRLRIMTVALPRQFIYLFLRIVTTVQHGQNIVEIEIKPRVCQYS